LLGLIGLFFPLPSSVCDSKPRPRSKDVLSTLGLDGCDPTGSH
jgi:hypothetical protein